MIVGNFAGTLVVYVAAARLPREQLGLEFDRPLLREMNRFGLPLVPAALALARSTSATASSSCSSTGQAEVGLYSVGVRIASAMVLLLTAFRLAWPAFAYSIRDDDEAKRTYAFVLTYLVARSRRGSRSRSGCSRPGSSAARDARSSAAARAWSACSRSARSRTRPTS